MFFKRKEIEKPAEKKRTMTLTVSTPDEEYVFSLIKENSECEWYDLVATPSYGGTLVIAEVRHGPYATNSCVLACFASGHWSRAEWTNDD